MIAFVVIVAVETPDAADDDERADAVIPKIAKEVKAQVGPGSGATETGVVVNDHLRQLDVALARCRGCFADRRGVVSIRFDDPFRVDDRAVFWRWFGFGCLSHKQLFLQLNR